ncbi:MAG: sigma-54-dependent transcriptional regulator [Granulosicoccus sp.]
MNKPHTALIIDDEADIRELIAMSLDRIGLETHTAANLEEAEHLLNTYSFDVCLTDMRLPDGNGVDFVKKVHVVQPDLPVAVITAHGSMSAAVEAMKNGAFDFVSKPVDLKLLRKLVIQAIKARSDYPPDKEGNESQQTSLKSSNGHIPPTLTDLSGRVKTQNANVPLVGQESLIGCSAPMQLLRNMIRKVARTNAPVWVTGESGTGKELIARLIHDNSPRANSQFVAVNCGAIPSELMESEMFGHRKGSFTGAHSDHDGLFIRATGGTLFLDEVAELPLHMQVKLLRAIQERSIRPVGSSNEIMTDARIVSASHKNLAKEVEEGRFRHDLYYRLNVICIKAPSLRERCEDVVDIAHHILKSIAKDEGITKPTTLSPDAEKHLSLYAFPGNVRELENILERAVAMTDGKQIDAVDLNIDVNQLELLNTNSTVTNTVASKVSSEVELIKTVLNNTHWNRKAAAQQLGLTYRQLRYRIKQHGLDQDKTGT